MSIPVKEMKAEAKPVVVSRDDSGRVTVCTCCVNHKTHKVAMIRASGHELRSIFPKWFADLGAETIISHEQSESEGNVTITIFYR